MTEEIRPGRQGDFKRECARALSEQWIREQLRLGMEAADRGEIEPFNPAVIKSRCRERLSKQ
ncbi:MAG: hypothetical protein AB7O59_13990 [Pirellulales bacterium]